MIYKWNKKDGLLDETGRQILQIVATNCTAKFRDMVGKELAEKLNTIERGKMAGKIGRNSQ